MKKEEPRLKFLFGLRIIVLNVIIVPMYALIQLLDHFYLLKKKKKKHLNTMKLS